MAFVSLLSAGATSLVGPAPRLSREVVPVASDAMVVDRVPMQVHRYRSRLPPEGVLALWPHARSVARPRGESAGGWHIVSRLRGSLQETLQARPDGSGGSEILLACLDLQAPLAAPVRPPFPLPAGSAILRTVSFDDPAGRARQFVVSLPGEPGHAMHRLCPRLLEGGWRPVGTEGCERPAAARWYLRDNETLGIDLRGDGAATRAIIGYVVPRS